MTRRIHAKKIADRALDYAFVIPAVFYMCYFIIYPIFFNFILSVNRIGMDFFMTRRYDFVGLRNYIAMFTRADGLLLNALRNTLLFTFISITLQVLISFSLALFLTRKNRFSQISRGIIVISYIIPQAVTGLLFRFIFSKDGGIINHLLLSVGILNEPVGWLLTPNAALAAIIGANIWINVPFSMLLFTAGLTTVDPTYVEAAMIDGAGWWRRLFNVIIPSISETIKVVLTLGFINTFKIFDLVLIMTNGGPGSSTEMLSTFAYKLSFQLNRFDDSAVVSNVLFLVLMLVGLFYIKTIRSEGDT
jgi:multiple sugar transport system permease protein